MTKPDGPRYRRYTSETRGAMLIEAGMKCLARGGITAFTIDNICREAGASRGLVTHHFGSKEGLLAAVYATMYDRFTMVLDRGATRHDICALVEANFDPEVFNPDSLRIWLALWGEIATNDELRVVHRQRYRDLMASVATALADEAETRGKRVDAEAVAVMFIALTDGLWLEQGIDTAMMSRDAAREACYRFLESHLGPLSRPGSGG